MRNFFLFLFITGLFIPGCKKKNQNNIQPKPITNETLLKANTHLIKEDDYLIKKYCSRKEWVMQQTKTGLYYNIVQKNESNNLIKHGNTVTINYRVELLDGRICYSSTESGPMTFKVGHQEIESGLYEGIQLLSTGDSAIFILPPHLAHGFLGDEKKIPIRSTIVYYIRVLKVEP